MNNFKPVRIGKFVTIESKHNFMGRDLTKIFRAFILAAQINTIVLE